MELELGCMKTGGSLESGVDDQGGVFPIRLVVCGLALFV